METWNPGDITYLPRQGATQYVLAVGSQEKLYGPFTTAEAAVNYAKAHFVTSGWSIVPVRPTQHA